MIAITTQEGRLLRAVPELENAQEGETFGFHSALGFTSERALNDRARIRRLHGLRTDLESSWLCRFQLLPASATEKVVVRALEGCQVEKVATDDGQSTWKLVTRFGEYKINRGIPAKIAVERFSPHERSKDRAFLTVVLILALLCVGLFVLEKNLVVVETAPPAILEPIAVNIAKPPEKEKTVKVPAPPVPKELVKPEKKEVRRAIEQKLGFLGLLGKKDLKKALGGMPTRLKDASAGAGLGGTEGSGGELLVGLGAGVKRTTVGNTGTAGLGGIGTKGAGGGLGGYGNSMIGSGEGKGLTTLPLAADLILEGGLDRSVIQATIAKYLSQVRACYEGGLQKKADLAGTVSMAFQINPSGILNYSRVAKSTLGDPQVESCIATRMMTWKFPKPVGGVNQKVEYPFSLRPIKT